MSDLTSEQIEELEASFDHFDRDNNGRIDLDEFMALIAALDDEIGSAEARIGFSEIDVDGNGSIDLDEFMSWWTSR